MYASQLTPTPLETPADFSFFFSGLFALPRLVSACTAASSVSKAPLIYPFIYLFFSASSQEQASEVLTAGRELELAFFFFFFFFFSLSLFAASHTHNTHYAPLSPAATSAMWEKMARTGPNSADQAQPL